MIKKFPLDFEIDEDEAQVYIFLSDGTLVLDLPSYKKNFICETERSNSSTSPPPNNEVTK